MQNQVIYWRGSGDLRIDLIKEFKARGFAIKHARTVDDVIKAATPSSLIVVDGSAGSVEATQRINELTVAEQLHRCPVLFIAHEAPTRTEILRTYYKRLLPVGLPFRADRVFADASGLATQAAESPPSPTESASEPEARTEPAPMLYERDRPRPSGAFLSSAATLSSFNDAELIPAHPKQSLLKQALDRTTERNEWLGLHSRRVALISQRIASTLSLSPERDANLRVVALLLNWGLLQEVEEDGDPLSLRSLDIFQAQPPPSIMADLARGLERTAEFLRGRLEDDQAARTVHAISALLLSGTASADANLIADAQVAMINEFADRACWGDGYWNPRGAHRAIRAIRQGVPVPVPQELRDAVSRLLLEAIIARDSLLARPLPSMAGESATVAPSGPVDGARPVRLLDLRPGMALAQPVISRSGKVVAPASVVLDEDLISRLWQLAAITPLVDPLWVQ